MAVTPLLTSSLDLENSKPGVIPPSPARSLILWQKLLILVRQVQLSSGSAGGLAFPLARVATGLGLGGVLGVVGGLVGAGGATEAFLGAGGGIGTC